MEIFYHLYYNDCKTPSFAFLAGRPVVCLGEGSMEPKSREGAGERVLRPGAEAADRGAGR